MKNMTKQSGINIIHRKGFSLVELLVTMVIMFIVSGAALIMFRTMTENESRQQENLEHIQNLRAAFSLVSRDARMAGNGLGILGTPLVQVYVHPDVFNADASGTQEASGWFSYKGETKYGARAIFGTDSGAVASEADTLTIFHAEVESAKPIARLGSTYTPGDDNSITLDTSLAEGVEISNGDIIALSTGTVSLILQAQITNTSNVITIGPRFMPEEKMKDPVDFVFPAGTTVYNLRDISFVTYFLDTSELILMANYHDRVKVSDAPVTFKPNIVTVARNIEDFQVAYFVAPSGGQNPVAGPLPPTVNLRPEGSNWINALRIGMVSRSARNIHGDSGGSIDLMGHTADGTSGFSRRLLIENIQLRNF